MMINYSTTRYIYMPLILDKLSNSYLFSIHLQYERDRHDLRPIIIIIHFVVLARFFQKEQTFPRFSNFQPPIIIKHTLNPKRKEFDQKLNIQHFQTCEFPPLITECKKKKNFEKLENPVDLIAECPTRLEKFLKGWRSFKGALENSG